MAKLIFNESAMIEANLKEFESRTHSPLNRFLESTPTFVTYYHINSPESTADVGFKDIQQILGKDSPLRFNRITNFPIYNIEQIIPNLQATEFGLDIDFSSQGIILPNTIIPRMNDCFMIEHLHSIYIFFITEIAYDTLRPDGYYQVTFKLTYTDKESLENLYRQTIENNVCILENIGTEKNSIILDVDYVTIQSLQKMLEVMIDSYISMFYDKRHNCFIGKITNFNRFFDQYMHTFIRHTRVLSNDNSVDTIYTPIKIDDPKHDRKYSKTVWSWIERGYDLSKFESFPFDIHKAVSYVRSSFERYVEMDIMVSDILFPMNKTTQFFFTQEYVDSVMNDDLNDLNSFMRTLGKLLRKDIKELNEIPIDLQDWLLEENDARLIYQYTPILIYLIKEMIGKKIALVNAI